jgi:7,8-dihydropterin-6-yl-methyl-4-(beta-D-ribofuranosyl)aminobenzene 5'-phosphate synthase
MSEKAYPPASWIPSKNDFEMEKETMKTDLPPAKPLMITVVYDNMIFDPQLKTSWGFSALVEYQGHTLLFDTGGDGPTLAENMRALGIDADRIERIVLSHIHADHTGGLIDLLDHGFRPTIYLPSSFPAAFITQVSSTTKVVKVMPGQEIDEDIFTTGQMGRDIPEQALVIKTEQGIVIITGCAHPGIIEVVKQARERFKEPVRLVLGGFHLKKKSQKEVNAIVRDFRRLEVQQVAPSHCTGEQAIAMFAVEYGEDLIQAGVGRKIILDRAGQ